MTKPTQKVQRMSGEIQMQADLSHCLFSVPNRKKLPVDQKLTKIIASGWFWIVFIFGIENGEAQLDKSWRVSVHTKKGWQCRNLKITLWSSEATALARKASNSIVKHSVCMLCQIKESYDISSFENWLLRWRGELLEMNSSIYLD